MFCIKLPTYAVWETLSNKIFDLNALLNFLIKYRKTTLLWTLVLTLNSAPSGWFLFFFLYKRVQRVSKNRFKKTKISELKTNQRKPLGKLS